MENMKQVSTEVLDLLRNTDTCTVSNAIETFDVRMRNEGYIQDGIRCLLPQLHPVVGYAVTGRIRTSNHPIANLCYYHRIDWWQYVDTFPSPRILVLEDMDRIPGIGAFVGKVHAQIAKALNCVAYVSNGSVRDVHALERESFQCFAGGTSVSHAYAHIMEFGEPVEICGLKIAPGDLLQGDVNGVQTIPVEVAPRLPEAVAEIVKREAELIHLCKSPGFSLESLATLLGRESSKWQPPDHR
jgi:4-hydroxy-4-methyl-2-oxoglutarate aldolase